MPSLMLLRHAKSDWGADFGDDRSRPLNRRGLRSAEAMGRFIADCGLAPELMLVSPAVRTASTAELAMESGGWGCRLERTPGLYGADPSYVLTLIRGVSGVERVMVVGHEPAMSGFVEKMTGSRLRMPTAALASLSLTYGRWADASWGAAEVELYVRPRLLAGARR